MEQIIASTAVDLKAIISNHFFPLSYPLYVPLTLSYHFAGIWGFPGTLFRPSMLLQPNLLVIIFISDWVCCFCPFIGIIGQVRIKKQLVDFTYISSCSLFIQGPLFPPGDQCQLFIKNDIFSAGPYVQKAKITQINQNL